MSESRLLGHFGESTIFTYSLVVGIAAVATSLGLAPDWIVDKVQAYYAPLAALVPAVPVDWLYLLVGAVLLSAARAQVSTGPQLGAALIAPVVMVMELALYFVNHDDLPGHPLCRLGEAVCDGSTTAQIVILGACSFVLLTAGDGDEVKKEEESKPEVSQEESKSEKEEVKAVETKPAVVKRKRSSSKKRK
jgi:hypothetical protein